MAQWFRYILQVYWLILRYLTQTYIHYILRWHGINIDSTAMIVRHSQIYGRVTIGAETIVDHAQLDGRGGLVIGRKVIINEAKVITAQHDFDSPEFETTYGEVIIEDYAILLPGSIILPGRRIGKGAIVAAGAVVTRDIPEMTIVAGNPARIIRQRQHVHSQIDMRRIVGFAPKRWLQFIRRIHIRS